MIGLLWMIGCEPTVLAESQTPDLVVVLADGAVASGAASPPSGTGTTYVWDQLWPPSDRLSLNRTSLLLGRWPDDASPRASANGLAEILGFYGYRTAAFVGADPAVDPAARAGFVPWDDTGGCVEARLDTALSWGRRTDWAARIGRIGAAEPEPPFFALVIPDEGCATTSGQITAILDAHSLSARVSWALVSDTRLTLGGPRVSPPEGSSNRLITTFDLMPTLLGLARATVPSDTLGQDLLDPATPARAGVVQQLQDGSLVLHRADARFRVPAARVVSWTAGQDPTGTPPGVVERGDPALGPELEAVCAEWLRRRYATSAMDKMGSAAFEELQGAGGYWP